MKERIKRKTDILNESFLVLEEYKSKLKDVYPMKDIEERIFLEQLYNKVISKKINSKKKEGFDSKELIKDIIFNNISQTEAVRKYNINSRTYHHYIKLIRKCYIEFNKEE